MFNVVASCPLTIHTYDVIIAQLFGYTLVLASFILRHECDDLCDLSIKDRSQAAATTTEAGFYNKHTGTHDVDIQMT